MPRNHSENVFKVPEIKEKLLTAIDMAVTIQLCEKGNPHESKPKLRNERRKKG